MACEQRENTELGGVTKKRYARLVLLLDVPPKQRRHGKHDELLPFRDSAMGKIQGVFGRLDRNHQSIKETTLIWGNNNFSIPVLKQAWGLALGFNLRMIWKE